MATYTLMISGHINEELQRGIHLKERIIGRYKEKKILQKIFNSPQAEFLAVYGRRRIGKTFLIREFFTQKPCYYFQVTGVKDGLLKEQLCEFTRSIEKEFYQKGTVLKEPGSWMQALEMLTTSIEQYTKNKKVILFFDELPWLATKKSRLLQALEYYWNTKWSNNKRIKLIVCGSAATWIIRNILNNKAGLHNRITEKIRLDPFSLKEAMDFIKSRGINFGEKQILHLYMAMGGVPFYLLQVEKGLSASQNIDKLCFTKSGILFNEFNNLIPSLFNDSEIHEKIIRVIADRRYGIERRELLKKSKQSSGGRINQRLLELEEAGFITSFKPYGHVRRGQYYRIFDEYIKFYLDWIEPVASSIRHHNKQQGYWEGRSKSAEWNSWSGYAFESVCYKHIGNIMTAINIPVTAEVGTWRFSPPKGSEERGAQIDLLFDRDDGIVTICEIKYSTNMFEIDKEYAGNLHKKIDVFKKQSNIDKTIFVAMITAGGLKENQHSKEMVTNQVNMSHIMKE